jgi:peptide/nickel transport system ATP-binding protein
MLITHDLSVLFGACERVAVMYAGRVVEQGPSDALMATPQHPYTAALAAAFPTIGDRASRKAPQGLGGDPPDPQQLPTGCSFHPRCAVARPECTDRAMQLWPAGDGREAACVRVLDESARLTP